MIVAFTVGFAAVLVTVVGLPGRISQGAPRALQLAILAAAVAGIDLLIRRAVGWWKQRR